MKFTKKDTGEIIDAPESEAHKLVASEQFDFAKGAEIPFTSPDGRNFYIPSEKASEAIKNGWQLLSHSQAEEIQKEKEFGGDSIANDLIAGGLSAASTLTFGASDYLLPKTGLIDEEEITNYRKYNPIVSGTTEVAAAIAPLIFTGGTSLLAKGAGKAGRLVVEAQKASQAVGRLASKKIQNQAMRKAAELGVEAATESVLFGLGREISEVSLGNKEFNAVSVIGDMGMNALLGFGTGVALKGVQTGSLKAYTSGKKQVAKTLEKLFGVTDEARIIDIGADELVRSGKFLNKPIIKATKDAQINSFKYSDAKKEAFLNTEGLKHLDLNNDNQLTELGEKLGIPGLPDVMAAYTGKIEDLPIEFSRLKAKTLQDKAIALGASKKPESFIKLQGKAKKEIEKILDGYDAISLNDDLIGFAGKMDTAFTTGFAKGFEAVKKVEPVDALWFKALGATQTDIKKIRQGFSAEEIKRGREVGKGLFRNKGKGLLKPFMTATDEFVDNLNSFKLKVDADLDGAVMATTNLLNEAAENIPKSKLLYTNDLAREIESKIIPALGEISDARPKILDIANKLRNGESFYRLTSSGKKEYIPMSPAMWRDIRGDIDDVIKWGRKEGVTKAEEAAIKIRNLMEDKLVDLVETLPKGKAIAEKYKKAKQDYRSFFLLENVVDKLQNKQGNNIFGLSSTLGGVAGAGLGGLPGMLAGGIVTEGIRRHGSLATAKMWEYLAKDKLNMAQAIDSAVTDFLKNKSGKAVNIARVGIVKGVQSAQSFSEISDNIIEKSSNLEQFMNDFEEKNYLLKESAPDNYDALLNTTMKAVGLLDAKLPKPQIQSFGKKYQPSDYEMSKFMRYNQAVTNPISIIENIKSGYISNEEIEVLKNVYPALYDGIYDTLLEKYEGQELTYTQRSFVNKLTGIITDKSLEPMSVLFLQQSFQPIEQNSQYTKISKDIDPAKRSMSSLDRTLDRRNLE